jgi:hypothetical protein
MNLTRRWTRNVRGGIAFWPLVAMLFIVSLLAYRTQGGSVTDMRAAQAQGADNVSAGDTSQPFYAKSQSEAKQEGQLSFIDRPAAVRSVMERMWNNDSLYRTLSATFVDHEPQLPHPGALRIELQQPDGMRVAAFDNDAAVGTPLETVQADGDQLRLYAPGANVATSMARLVSSANAASRLPPIATAPLSVVAHEDSGSSLYSSFPLGTLADQFIHPAELITSLMFTNKAVKVVGEVVIDGRPAWELDGTQIPTATRIPMGDSWQMWVDKQTGVVLRLEFYSAGQLIGWAALTRLVVDHPGDSTVQAADLWTIPANARVVDPAGYRMATRGD